MIEYVTITKDVLLKKLKATLEKKSKDPDLKPLIKELKKALDILEKGQLNKTTFANWRNNVNNAFYTIENTFYNQGLGQIKNYISMIESSQEEKFKVSRYDYQNFFGKE